MDAQNTVSMTPAPGSKYAARNRKRLKNRALVKASKQPGGPVITNATWLRKQDAYAASVLAASNAAAVQNELGSSETRNESMMVRETPPDDESMLTSQDDNIHEVPIKAKDKSVDEGSRLEAHMTDHRPKGAIKIERREDVVKVKDEPDAVENKKKARDEERTPNAMEVEPAWCERKEVPPSIVDGGYNGPVTW